MNDFLPNGDNSSEEEIKAALEELLKIYGDPRQKTARKGVATRLLTISKIIDRQVLRSEGAL